eukprot:SM000037S13465  [mRNA]  locus=s37:43200:49998:+ [translate_table: standard]
MAEEAATEASAGDGEAGEDSLRDGAASVVTAGTDDTLHGPPSGWPGGGGGGSGRRGGGDFGAGLTEPWNAIAESISAQKTKLKRRRDISRSRRIERSSDTSSFSQRVAALKPVIIYPQNKYYQMWQHVLLLAAAYSSVVTPFEFGFYKGTGLPRWWELFDIAMNLIFMADIALNFCLAYVDRATYVLIDDRTLIAKRYARTRLLPDLLACLPWDSLYKASGRQETLRVFNWFRLFRARHVDDFLARCERDIRFNYFMVRVVKLLVVELFCGHVAGCLFYYLATTIPAEDEADTWIGSLTLGANSYKNFRELSLGKRYITALYWAIVTMTTIGDESKRDGLSIIYISFDMILGAYLIGNMTALIVRGSNTSRYRETVTSFTNFAKRNNLPRGLRRQMKAHVVLQFQTNEQKNNEILHTFPTSIQAKVARHLYAHTVGDTYLFDGCSNDFITQIVNNLVPEHLFPGEVVLKQHDAAGYMFFVHFGVLEEIMSEGGGEENILNQIFKNQVFGEVALLCSIAQPCTVRVKEYCHLVRIDKQSFQTIVQTYVRDGKRIVTNLLKNLIMEREDEDKTLRSKFKHLAAEVDALINQQQVDLTTMAISISARGDLEQLRQLVQAGANPCATDYDGRTSLHLASSRGYYDVVSYLIQEGADVNCKDHAGVTPLLEALKGGHDKVASILLRHGGDVQLEAPASELCNAVMNGNIDYVRRLLENGVDPNSADYDLRTPLHVAAAEGYVVFVRLLLDAGASLLARDRWGNLPLDEAIRSSSQPVISLLEGYMESLIAEEGLETHFRDPIGGREAQNGDMQSESAEREGRREGMAGGEERAKGKQEAEEGAQGEGGGEQGERRVNFVTGARREEEDGLGESMVEYNDRMRRLQRLGSSPQLLPSPASSSDLLFRRRNWQSERLLPLAVQKEEPPPPAPTAELRESQLAQMLEAATHAASMPETVGPKRSLLKPGSPLLMMATGVTQRPGRRFTSISPWEHGSMSSRSLSMRDEPTPQFSRANSLNSFVRKRVTLFPHHPWARAEQRRSGRTVLLPASIEELLEYGAKHWEGPFQSVLSQEGGMIETLNVVRDNDSLYLVAEDDIIPDTPSSTRWSQANTYFGPP